MSGLVLAGLIFWAQDDAAAKSAIAEFNAAYKKAKTVNEKMTAIQNLNRTPHPLIVKELVKLLKDTDLQIRKTLLFEIGKYKKSKTAGEALVKELSSEAALAKQDASQVYAGQEMFQAVCQALCGAQYWRAAPALTAYFKHDNLEVGKAAIRTCGELKNVEAVDALLALLREWEGAKVDDPYAKPNGGGGGVSGGSNDFVRHGGPQSNKPSGSNYSSEELSKIDKFNRKNQLPQVIVTALNQITGQQLKTAADWDKWWNANKGPLLKEAKERAKAADLDD